jgi:excisionase family DNA binding protein
MVLPVVGPDPLVPDERAASAVRTLQELLGTADAQPLRIVTAAGQAMEMPASVERALRTVVATLAAGDAVTVAPLHRELSTSQAARLLAISRPTLITLLERGQLPYYQVGSHRRIALTAVLAYREHRAAAAAAHLDAILAEAQKTGDYF